MREAPVFAGFLSCCPVIAKYGMPDVYATAAATALAVVPANASANALNHRAKPKDPWGRGKTTAAAKSAWSPHPRSENFHKIRGRSE